jgi:hypothetical protein
MDEMHGYTPRFVTVVQKCCAEVVLESETTAGVAIKAYEALRLIDGSHKGKKLTSEKLYGVDQS